MGGATTVSSALALPVLEKSGTWGIKRFDAACSTFFLVTGQPCGVEWRRLSLIATFCTLVPITKGEEVNVGAP
jgi:hypothetical protein